MKLARQAVVAAALLTSTVALAQNTVPQIMPSQPLNAAQSMAQAPAATPAAPERNDKERGATGGQTQGGDWRPMEAGSGLFGMSMAATFAIITGLAVIIALANDDGGGAAPATQHQN